MFEETNQTATENAEMNESTQDQGDSGEDMFMDEAESAEENKDTDAGEKAAGEEEGQEKSNEEGQNQSQGSEAEGKKEEKSAEGKPAEDAKTIPIKFNGEIIEVPVDQAQILIQKGMNYDHVKGEVEEFRGTLEFYAKQNGLTVPQYIKALKDQQETAAVQAEIKVLSGKMPDENPEVIKMLAELIHKDKQHEAEKAADKEKKDAEAKEDEKYRAFAKKYPDIKEFPPEVAQKIKAGEDPISAYQDYENQKLKDQIAQMEVTKKTEEKNKSNKNTALGSLEGENTNTERDPFLDGLNSN